MFPEHACTFSVVLLRDVARGEFHQAAELIDLFLVGLAIRPELHTIVVPATMANHSRSPRWRIGIGWRELNGDSVPRSHFLTGEDQHAALADVAGASINDADVLVTIDDHANRQLKAVAQPAPEDGFFLGLLGARVRATPQPRLSCHVAIITQGFFRNRLQKY